MHSEIYISTQIYLGYPFRIYSSTSIHSKSYYSIKISHQNAHASPHIVGNPMRIYISVFTRMYFIAVLAQFISVGIGSAGVALNRRYINLRDE